MNYPKSTFLPDAMGGTNTSFCTPLTLSRHVLCGKETKGARHTRPFQAPFFPGTPPHPQGWHREDDADAMVGGPVRAAPRGRHVRHRHVIAVVLHAEDLRRRGRVRSGLMRAGRLRIDMRLNCLYFPPRSAADAAAFVDLHRFLSRVLQSSTRCGCCAVCHCRSAIVTRLEWISGYKAWGLRLAGQEQASWDPVSARGATMAERIASTASQTTHSTCTNLPRSHSWEACAALGLKFVA
jgi:hypothetical protein